MSLLCREIQCDDSDTVPPPFLRMPPCLRRRAMRTRRAASHRAHARRSTRDNRHGRSDGQRAGDGDQTGTYARNRPVRASVVGRETIERRGVTAIKELSQLVPNFHIPDYGSRMTPSVYVRGLGARIDQPVMGLNVDNVPYLSKDDYDFDLADIERVEVLRGPQSTLYGRNTMGGVMNIYTSLAARLRRDAAGCGVCLHGQHAAAARLKEPTTAPRPARVSLAGGAVHARRRLFHQRIHGTHLRLGAFGRGTDAASIPPRRAVEHRQHPRVRDAPAGRLPLCLGRDGAHRLQRPLRLPPHDAQRRSDDTLRRRRVGDRLDHQLPVQRRPHDARPGFPARIAASRSRRPNRITG